jgi:phosphate transport system substrate-binding protein
VTPSLEATSAAAAGVEMPADYRISITDPAGTWAWPIASFTYLIVHRDQREAIRGNALLHFLWWALHDGRDLEQPLEYAPLPRSVAAKVEKTLDGLTVQGQPLHLAAR